MVPVDLVKGGDGEAEVQVTEGVLQEILPPEGVVLLAQNDVGLGLVHRQDHAHQPRLRRPERLDELVLLGEPLPVGDDGAISEITVALKCYLPVTETGSR